MRLICPNCDAQYEVGEGVIPADGRDVQCSNCGHTWFQYPDGYDDRPQEQLEDDRSLTSQVQDNDPVDDELADDNFEESLRAALDSAEDENDAEVDVPKIVSESEADFKAAAEAATLDDEPEMEPSPVNEPDIEPIDDIDTDDKIAVVAAAASAGRRALPDDIAEILRTEAKREREARGDDSNADLETQSDLGLDEPSDRADRRATNARRRMAQFRGDDGDDSDFDDFDTPSEKSVDKSKRSSTLPDIDDINSSLRATSDRKREAAAAATDPAQKSRSRRSGFRLGFYLMIFAAIGLGMAYVMAPKIIEALPQAEPYVSAWVKFADQLRWSLDGLIRAAIRKIAELTG